MSNDDGVPPIPPPPPGQGRPNPHESVEGTTPAASPYGAAPGAGAPGTPPPYGAAPGAPGAPAPATPGKGMAITALVLGIIALLGVAIPILNIGSLIMAIVGLILGFVALNKYTTSKGLPISAVIVSAIATLLSLVFVVLYTIGFIALLQEADEEGIFEPVPSASPEPTETTEPAPDASEEPGEGDGNGAITDISTPSEGPGSFDEPLAIGETVLLTEFDADAWEITVDAVELDATELVLTSNEFNDPPADGFQYAMLTLTATNVGESATDPWFGVEVNYYDADFVEFTQFDQQVTEPDPAWFSIGSVAPGDTATGNLVVMIPSDSPADGVWLVFSFIDSAGYVFEAE